MDTLNQLAEWLQANEGREATRKQGPMASAVDLARVEAEMDEYQVWRERHEHDERVLAWADYFRAVNETG